MKKLNLIPLLILVFTVGVKAQESDKNNVEAKSYYEQRAQQDAKYEQDFIADNVEKEESFWDDQKQYEKDLKKRDRKAYRAYMKGKRDAYAEHYSQCNTHCHHSDHYYSHATFYYNGYNRNYYRSSNSTSVRTNVQWNTPRIGVSLF